MYFPGTIYLLIRYNKGSFTIVIIKPFLFNIRTSINSPSRCSESIYPHCI